MPLKLFEFDKTDFESGCIAYLGEAYNVAVTENLQQPHTLEFEYPINGDTSEMILENRIVTVEGQAYRLTNITRVFDGTRTIKAKAERIFFIDASFKHIPTIGNDTGSSTKIGISPYTAYDTIGVDPYVVISEAVKDTKFTLIDEDELTELGMTRIGADGTEIDFFPTDKINVYDVINSVIEAIGYGEIYVDNFRFAVVERIGADNGLRLTLKKNLKSLSVERQITELTTRLYPYGADDLTISSVNGGVPYIDSEDAQEKYGIIEGYKDYTDYDYTNVDKLMANAKWDLMGEDNDYRLDTPQITITGNVIDLSKLAEYGDFEKISLGDTVHVYDGSEVYHKRVTNITYYPYGATQPTVTIGSPSNTNRFIAAWQKSKLFKTVQKNSGRNNTIKTSYFTGTVNITQNPVKSENEQLLLDGDLLYIKDGSRVRIRIGNYNGEFVFIIYDTKGNRAVYLNEDGEAVFAGSIDTEKDAKIGSVLYVQTTEHSGLSTEPAIRFLDSDGNTAGEISCNENGYLRLTPQTSEGKVLAGNSELATKDDINGLKEWVSENFVKNE